MHIYAAAAASFIFLVLFAAPGNTRAWAPPDYDEWVNHGRDLTNDRWARSEKQISTSSIGQLTEKWTVTTDSDVTATPSIADGVVYFPDWSGALYAVKKNTGALLWKKNLTALAAHSLGSGNVTLFSRSTPTIAGDRLLVSINGPCAVLALSRSTGELLWSKILDSNPFALVTMSGTAYEGFFYIGTSSLEEGTTGICCTFQGAFVKLDIWTGHIIWRVPMLPDNKGRADQYAGSAVWGSSPPIDVKRREVYIATGNTYRAPDEIDQCELNYRNLTNPPIPDPCIEPDNHAESVVAINIDSGKITWASHLGGYDTWIVTCSYASPGVTNCPTIPGPDYDFGQAPILLTIPSNASRGSLRDVVVVGQKSGIVWALERDTGKTVWDTAAGPGGSLGGSAWGITTDGQRVFTNIVNNELKNFTLAPGTTVITSSAWVGINATTGQVLWSTANPSGGFNPAPLTHANGVVFGGAASTPTAAVALDAKTGTILKFIPTNGSTFGGPSISNGCSFQPIGTSPTTIFAAAPVGVSIPHGNSVVAFCAPSAM